MAPIHLICTDMYKALNTSLVSRIDQHMCPIDVGFSEV